MSTSSPTGEVPRYRQEARLNVCKNVGATYLFCPDDCRLGLQREFDASVLPLHGLRHPSEHGETGWYVWVGELSDAPDFFQPVPAEQLVAQAPLVDPYLGLGPGWRFLLAPGHVDVWYDESLLAI